MHGEFAEIVIVLDVNVLKLRKIYIFLIFAMSPVRLTGKSVWGSCFSFLFYLVQFLGKIFDGTGGYCWVPWADFGSWVFEFITWVMHCSRFSFLIEMSISFHFWACIQSLRHLKCVGFIFISGRV
jgi:hypothetical protein